MSLWLEQVFRAPVRTVAAATAVNMVAVLPVFLFGGLAVLIRAELGFSAAQLGAAVSTFFAVSALASVPGGRLGERIGAYHAMVAGTFVSGIALLGLGLLSGTYLHLVAWLCLAALANATIQPSVNLWLARGVQASRRGFVFGVKEASIPVTLAAGAAVPLVALTVGWRWAFASAGVLAIVVIALVARPTAEKKDAVPISPRIQTPLRALLCVTVGGAFGAMGAIAMGTFYVESVVTSGRSVAAAGWWFAGGSSAGIVGRVAWGAYADRWGAKFSFVAVLLAAGAAGVAALAAPDASLLFLFGSIVAFAAGWGWMGVYSYVVVLRNPQAPAAATGVTQTGIFSGGVLGPVLFGVVVESVSYTAAWLAAAAAMLVAALLLQVGEMLGQRGGLDRAPAGACGPPPPIWVRHHQR